PTTFPATDTPDEDKDGMPGVTAVAVDAAVDPSYGLLPVGVPPTPGADPPRASRIAVVLRIVANIQGTATDCSGIRAAVEVPLLDGTPALNSMVVACMKTTGDSCSQIEAAFLNAALPQFSPTGPGTLVSTRVACAAGFPAARSRFPQ